MIKFDVKILYLFIACLYLNIMSVLETHAQSTNTAPLRMVVVGATHGHFPWVLERDGKTDVELVGIYEPNQELAQRYVERYGLQQDLFFSDLDKMLEELQPEAAVAFGSIYEHLAAVEACAPRGIHVMVEKPLATNVVHAERMAQLARDHNIHLLTNYETSWYPTTEKTCQLVSDSNYVGSLKRVVVNTGHQGPKEIGVGPEFLDWLTDPVQNGGGALIDFGCYGANIMTRLMQGEEPLSVTAVTRQFKTEIYPEVDDDATIIVTYPNAQCIIQASWNWPFNRKDMEVYGASGYLITEDNTTMRIRNRESGREQSMQVGAEEVGVYEDPFSYFADVIRGKIQLPEWGLYSLENNLMVVRILEAARESARTGQAVEFK